MFDETFLNRILSTLNKVEVKGKENLDYLLGAIMAIESALEQMGETTEEVEENNG